MFNVFSDLMGLYESKGIPVTDTYKKIASDALGPSLAYATPTMHGLVLTIFSSDEMIAHNLIQNSIDEAKGAARISLITERYSPPELRKGFMRQVEDEWRHSEQFLGLLPLVGYEYERVTDEESKKELANVIDFDDDLHMFGCRAHSIEIRSWIVLRLYKQVIEELGLAHMKPALPVLNQIMEDEIYHVTYLGRIVMDWMEQDAIVAESLRTCFAFTNRETWHDIARMAGFLADHSEDVHLQHLPPQYLKAA